jgi:hypothetical protein
MCRTADDDQVSTLGFPGIRFGDAKNANIWSDPFGNTRAIARVFPNIDS